MPNDYISRKAVAEMMHRKAIQYESGKEFQAAIAIDEARICLTGLPDAPVVEVVRCGKERLTKMGANGIYGLAKVKDSEQEVDSPYRNTLAAIVECFQRLAEYENAEFGTDGVEHHAD